MTLYFNFSYLLFFLFSILRKLRTVLSSAVHHSRDISYSLKMSEIVHLEIIIRENFHLELLSFVLVSHSIRSAQ